MWSGRLSESGWWNISSSLWHTESAWAWLHGSKAWSTNCGRISWRASVLRWSWRWISLRWAKSWRSRWWCAKTSCSLCAECIWRLWTAESGWWQLRWSKSSWARLCCTKSGRYCLRAEALLSVERIRCVWCWFVASWWSLAAKRRLTLTSVWTVLWLASFRVIINVCIVSIQTWCWITIELIPPNTDEILLTENRSVRTKEIECCVQCTNVEYLTLSFNVGIISR